MTLHVTLKGGKGSGWHAPPKGTHTGEKHRASGSGKSGKVSGSVKNADGVESLLNSDVPIFDIGVGDWQNASDEARKAVKSSIVRSLMSDEISQGDASDFVKQWSHSSNDNDMRSLAMQEDAAAEFGIPMSEFTQGKIDDITAKREATLPRARSMVPELNPLMSSEKQRELLRTTYDNTQQALRDAGYGPDDSITLYRGVQYQSRTLSPEHVAAGRSLGSVPISGNPLESWSVSADVAATFAVGTNMENKISYVLKSDIPVKNIVSTARTGIGCLTEGEVITMGSVVQQATVHRGWEEVLQKWPAFGHKVVEYGSDHDFEANQ